MALTNVIAPVVTCLTAAGITAVAVARPFEIAFFTAANGPPDASINNGKPQTSKRFPDGRPAEGSRFPDGRPAEGSRFPDGRPAEGSRFPDGRQQQNQNFAPRQQQQPPPVQQQQQNFQRPPLPDGARPMLVAPPLPRP
jgi:hypothetical protein